MSWLRVLLFVCSLFVSFLLHAQGAEIDSLSRLLINETDPIARVKILNERAFYLINENPGDATRDVEEAMSLALSKNFQSGIARSKSIMGSIHWAIGDYDHALASYFEALSDYELLNDSLGMTRSLNNLAEVNKKLGNYKNSLQFLKRAQILAESIAEPLTIYINLGELFTFLNQFDSANFYFQRALANPIISSSSRQFAMTLLGLAEVSYLTKDEARANERALQALEYFTDIGHLRGQAATEFLLAKITYDMGNADQSSYFFDRALDHALKVRDRNLQMQVYKTLSDILVVHRDFEGALQEYTNYVAVKDSMLNELKTAQISHLESRYETELLLNDKASAEKELRSKNIAILGIIMLLILSLAIVKILISQRGRQRKINQMLEANNRMIEEQNEKILAQSEELVVLNDNLKSVNDSLEAKIKKRTLLLEEKNKVLEEYAYANAHELRAPVASILGLTNLLQGTDLGSYEKELIGHLADSTKTLDDVLRSLREKLSDNIDD